MRPMRIVHSPDHIGHDPESFISAGRLAPSPECPERAHHLFAAQQNDHHQHGKGGDGDGDDKKARFHGRMLAQGSGADHDPGTTMPDLTESPARPT